MIVTDPNLLAQPPPDVAIEFNGSLQAFGQQVQGAFSLRKTTADDQPNSPSIISIGVAEVGLRLQAGDTRIAELADGNGAMLLTADGLAGRFNVTLVDGPEIPGVEMGGTFAVAFNQTVTPVPEIQFTRNGELVTETVNLSAGPFTNLGVSSGTLTIDEFAHVTGDFHLSLGTPLEAPLSGTSPETTQSLEVITIGASQIKVFVGIDGPYFTDLNNDGVITGEDVNGNGVIDAEESDELHGEAAGLFVEGARLALLLAAPEAHIDPTTGQPLPRDPNNTASYTALRVQADSVRP